MSVRGIPFDQIPGFYIVQQILRSIDSNVSVLGSADDKDLQGYLLILTGRGRKGRAILSYSLLRDVRDNQQASESEYTRELHGKVESALRKAVAKMA